MSERDKKLLVYLGALIILAGAYFLVGRPFLDKIDNLSTEKMQLESQLSEKRKALENKETYEQGIVDAEARIQEIIAEFPEDNTDEKSIMFVANTEKEIPAWFAQIKFADVIENNISGESASDIEAEAEQEAVATAEGEESDLDGEEAFPEVADSGEAGGQNGVDALRDLLVRDTELGLSFSVKYDGFKKWLAYIRDYDDRIVIKEIEVSYEPLSDLVKGTVVLSQYALIGPDRELPPVETGIDGLGKNNVFVTDGYSPSIIDLIGEIASELIDAITGGTSGSLNDSEENYFINVTTATDNTNAKTVGRAKDPSGTTYLTSDTNDKENVTFMLRGSDGRYYGEYELGEYKFTDDEFVKDTSGEVILRVISSSRKSDDDKSAISLNLINTSDIPLVVKVENDDIENPRVEIVSTEGDITVNN